jgi:hypothetical protein
MGDRGDEAESDVLRDVRWLAGQMHPAELVVCVVRGHGWGTDPGGADYAEDDSGEVELYFDDGADTTKRVPRAAYLGALAEVCLERGFADTTTSRRCAPSWSAARRRPARVRGRSGSRTSARCWRRSTHCWRRKPRRDASAPLGEVVGFVLLVDPCRARRARSRLPRA